MRLSQNADTWLSPEQIGSNKRPYRPTFPFDGFINANHRFYSICPSKSDAPLLINIGIPGSLRREDALKLYEMGYYAPSDILEIGCGNGLSTSILAQAVSDSDRSISIISVDLSEAKVASAKNNLTKKGLIDSVELRCGEAGDVCKGFEIGDRSFGFIFVDHSHAYDDVFRVCMTILNILQPGGFCLFHDFNDRRNLELSNAGYGVSRAVMATLGARRDFSFYGIYGCTALYRKEDSFSGNTFFSQ